MGRTRRGTSSSHKDTLFRRAHRHGRSETLLQKNPLWNDSVSSFTEIICQFLYFHFHNSSFNKKEDEMLNWFFISKGRSWSSILLIFRTSKRHISKVLLSKKSRWFFLRQNCIFIFCLTQKPTITIWPNLQPGQLKSESNVLNV